MGCCASILSSKGGVKEPRKITLKKNSKVSPADETTTSRENIRRIYKFDPKVIGNGHFGTIRIACLLTKPNKKYAVKTIAKEKIKKDLHLFTRELEILRSLDHPNIIKFYESYQDDKFFHLVMEYCQGGELLERIIERSHFTEIEAKKIVKKVISAVIYLHEKKICHRDLKPENFLFSDRGDDAEIKLIDFGLSRKFGDADGKYMTTVVGTPHYVAPEVLDGKYTERCDFWSVGVMVFLLLSGAPPFIGESNVEVFKNVKKGAYAFNDSSWRRVSDQAKDFISKLLVVDPKKRLTGEQALEHEWLKETAAEAEAAKTPLDPQIFSFLKSFTGSAKLRKEALRVMVNMMTENEIKSMKEAFKILDKDNTGVVTLQQLRKVMKDMGFKDIEKEIQNIMKTMDVHEGEGINYSDFLSATLDSKIYLTRERLWAAFKYFDVDNSNYITWENLREAMARGGRKIPESELKAMIQEFDQTKDGQISFEEFVNMMRLEKEVNFTTKKAPIKKMDTVDDIKEFRKLSSPFHSPSPQPTPIPSPQPTTTPLPVGKKFDWAENMKTPGNDDPKIGEDFSLGESAMKVDVSGSVADLKNVDLSPKTKQTIDNEVNAASVIHTLPVLDDGSPENKLTSLPLAADANKAKGVTETLPSDRGGDAKPVDEIKEAKTEELNNIADNAGDDQKGLENNRSASTTFINDK